MKDNFNELSRKYQEQMMKLYEFSQKRPEPPRPQPPRPEPPRPQPPRPEPPRPQPPRPEPPRPQPPRPEPPRPMPREIFANAPIEEVIQNDENCHTTPEIEVAPEIVPEMIPDNSQLPSDTVYDTPEGTQQLSEDTEYSDEVPESDYDALDENHLEENPELQDDDEFPEIPPYIQPVPPILPEEWSAQENYEQRNTAEGMLCVVAATADSAFPVPDARVTVYTKIGGKLHLNYMMTTNENGETPTVVLPAPPANLSQEPENIQPYSLCDIRIFAKGFFRSEALNVRIFADVVTRQTFQLVPLPLNADPDDNLNPNPAGRTEDEDGC